MQDIRIIQLKNFGKFQKRGGQTGNLFPAFSYFSRVEVSPVKTNIAGTSNQSLKEVYESMQACFRRSPEEYQSQQIILAFTDVKNRFQREQIRRFWDEKTSALFFTTLVNVQLGGDIEVAVERIKSIYGPARNGRYLIYYTLDHSEIIIFYKGDSFQEYAGKVMRLNYAIQPKAVNPIMDTITICGFGERSQYVVSETVDAYLQMDVTDYVQADAYIRNHGLLEKRWLLGRNDIAIWLPDTTLKMLYDLYATYDASWITTLNLSIQIKPDEKIEKYLNAKEALTTSGPALNRKKDALNSAINKLEQAYKAICRTMGSDSDVVIIRILYDINALIFDIDNAQLAEDLVIVLLPQIEGFVNYIIRVCEMIGDSKELALNVLNALQSCWNAFYLNIAALINNTVHSDRKFIQIPHYEATSFEMPPKMMAYYSMMAYRIASIFNDQMDVCYGIMLSPKLVNELEVEPFALRDIGEPHQMISINISEKMMYQPKRTVAILGHEIAHFISKGPRNRELRLLQILGYYIDHSLQQMFSVYGEMLPLSVSTCGGEEEYLELYISTEERMTFCKKMASTLLDEIKETLSASGKRRMGPAFTMRDVEQELEILPRRLFNNDCHRKEIFEQFVFPDDPNQTPLYLRSILRKLWFQTGLPTPLEKISLTNMPPAVRAQAKQYAKTQFFHALEHFPLFRDEVGALQDFWENTGYLFSEAYADIAMILIFDMSAQEYAALFIDGKKNDKLEETRFIAVVRAIKKCKEQPWKDGTHRGVRHTWGAAEHEWGEKIQKLMSACLGKNESRLEKIVEEDCLDAVQIFFLSDYLQSCITELRKMLDGNPDTKSLQKLYRTIDFDRSLQAALSEIMKMEIEMMETITKTSNFP